MENQEDKEISLKEALLAKYSDDQFEVNNLDHISFSPKREGKISFVTRRKKKLILYPY
jgi:hypothetical protein